MEEMKEVVQINLNDIIPNRFQPREVFDEKALKELAVSIKEHGVIQPITVREVNGKYEIIAGERRYKASALAGMTKIPAIIRNLDDKESSKVALLENLQRKNLNPIEEARTYQKILEIDQMTQDELAKTMGKSQSAVANKIRLLSLPDEVQEALLKEQISERHARALINVEDSDEQKKLLKKIVTNKMSVRALEEEIKKSKSEPKDISGMNMFVNNDSLSPTIDIPKNIDTFGKVTLAPPEGEDLPSGVNKFINYGDLEDNDDNEADSIQLPDMPSTIDTDDIKANSNDIPINDSDSSLDNLLNLSSISGNQNNNYITEAEKIVKNDSKETTKSGEDYFKAPDFSTFTIPANLNSNEEDSTQEDLDLNDDKETKIEKGIKRIKEVVSELKDKGLDVSADEMDFESSYQVIIKIDKE